MTYVSIVTPVYNNAPYLADAVESLLEQSYKPLEIIVVNDGSTDNSLDILETYTPYINLMNFEQNNGISFAYRKALKKAQGDIVVFMDADDISQPQRVKRIVEAFQWDKKISFLCSAMELINPKGRTIGNLSCPDFLNNRNVFTELLKQSYFTGSAMAVKRTGKLKFNLDINCNDLYICLKLLEDGSSFGYLKEPLLKYRIHPYNTSANREMMLSHLKKVLSRYSRDKVVDVTTSRGGNVKEAYIALGYINFHFYQDIQTALEYFYYADMMSGNVRIRLENKFYLGVIYYFKGQLEKSYEIFKGIEEYHRFELYNNLGILEFRIKNNAGKALQYFKKANAIEPRYLASFKNANQLIGNTGSKFIFTDKLYNEWTLTNSYARYHA